MPETAWSQPGTGDVAASAVDLVGTGRPPGHEIGLGNELTGASRATP